MGDWDLMNPHSSVSGNGRLLADEAPDKSLLSVSLRFIPGRSGYDPTTVPAVPVVAALPRSSKSGLSVMVTERAGEVGGIDVPWPCRDKPDT